MAVRLVHNKALPERAGEEPATPLTAIERVTVDGRFPHDTGRVRTHRYTDTHRGSRFRTTTGHGRPIEIVYDPEGPSRAVAPASLGMRVMAAVLTPMGLAVLCGALRYAYPVVGEAFTG
ncbi:hypothetical protein [Streptomyces sp. NPDC058751]|uniref:hypothetical protein n=1 Tax=Streptomyces sp. NPDC058751 TaxID=3346623 RepID=UPI0036A73455